MDYDDLAIKQIKSAYGDTCIIKSKTLLKFGENTVVALLRGILAQLQSGINVTIV